MMDGGQGQAPFAFAATTGRGCFERTAVPGPYLRRRHIVDLPATLRPARTPTAKIPCDLPPSPQQKQAKTGSVKKSEVWLFFPLAAPSADGYSPHIRRMRA